MKYWHKLLLYKNTLRNLGWNYPPSPVRVLEDWTTRNDMICRLFYECGALIFPFKFDKWFRNGPGTDQTQNHRLRHLRVSSRVTKRLVVARESHVRACHLSCIIRIIAKTTLFTMSHWTTRAMYYHYHLRFSRDSEWIYERNIKLIQTMESTSCGKTYPIKDFIQKNLDALNKAIKILTWTRQAFDLTSSVKDHAHATIKLQRLQQVWQSYNASDRSDSDLWSMTSRCNICCHGDGDW